MRHWWNTFIAKERSEKRERFNKLLDGLAWKRGVDATGRPQTYPAVAMMAALRQLAIGISPMSLTKKFGLSRQSMDHFLEKFCRDMVQKYSKKYLCPDLKKVVRRNKKVHGVPGLLGSLDCTHIYWGQCPNAHKGNFIDRHKRISVILEAVVDGKLKFVHFFFGYPGGSNDLNVLQGSP